MSQQTSTEVVTEVHAFIVDRFLFGQGAESLSSSQSFLAGAIVDSTGVLEIVMFLEERYGIKVNDDELVPDNLDSVNQIADFVARKLG
jgi:acyl carrier protein